MANQFLEFTIGSRTAPLGLSFWDSILGQTLSEGLQVTAWPLSAPSRRSEADVNRSNVFVFHHLPGMRKVEDGAGDDAFWQAPPQQRDFMIEVRDTRQPARFLPFEFVTSVPVRGRLAWAPPAGVTFPDLPSGMLPLLSAPTRPTPPGLGVIRVQLWDPNAPTPAGQPFAGAPAAWAVLTAKVGSLSGLRAVADASGQAALFFNYPAPSGVGPNGLVSTPLTKQSWTVELGVLYAPTPGPAPSSARLPEMLQQAVGRLWKKWDTDPVKRELLAGAPLKLEYGRELVLTFPASSPPGVLFVTQP